ncbi:MAG: Crp/Fnr family transcriptional regulator [Bacteroidota bacterium]
MQPDAPHFLKSIFKPNKFRAAELALVLEQYQRLDFKKSDYLIEMGEKAPFYYWLEEGYARAYAIDPDGNDITTAFYGPGDIVIDWHSYFRKSTCREDIQAITPCVAWKINFVNFMKLFHIEAFREVGRTALVDSYFVLKGHTVYMIADTEKERYLKLLRDKPDFAQNVPLKQIATYLGITDTSLSRIRKQIANQR